MSAMIKMKKKRKKWRQELLVTQRHEYDLRKKRCNLQFWIHENPAELFDAVAIGENKKDITRSRAC